MTSDTRVRCFGAGSSGRFAVEPSELPETCSGQSCAVSRPAIVTGSGATSLAVGDSFVCAAVDGEAICSGGNAFGTLGRGSHDRSIHATALAVEGSLRCVEIVAGRGHACCLTNGGEVACWGLGVHGELGRDPSTLDDCGLPVDAIEAARFAVGESESMACSVSAVLVPGLSGVDALRAGPYATCAHVVDGWRCFGRNVDGSLGVDSTDEAVTSPAPLTVVGTVDVALGPTHGCAIDEAGRLFCFGLGGTGQLGLGDAIPDVCGAEACARAPTRVIDVAVARRVVAGRAHTCVLLADGTVACFGRDAEGQVGDGADQVAACDGVPCARASRPARAPSVGSFATLHASDDGTCARSDDGFVYCWGDGSHGELGTPPPRTLASPTRVPGIP